MPLNSNVITEDKFNQIRIDSFKCKKGSGYSFIPVNKDYNAKQNQMEFGICELSEKPHDDVLIQNNLSYIGQSENFMEL